MTEALEIIRDWGPWALLALVVIFVVTNPEKAERLAGWFLHLFSWSCKGIRRHSIKLKIQGQVSTFARSIDAEVKGCMPYNMSLNLVKGVDRSELDPNKQMVIVCIKDRGADDRNLVHCMMAFCPIGVIPQARPYLSNGMNEGINVTVTRKFLNYLKHDSALQYLYDEVLPASIKVMPELDDFCRVFDVLDESGLFTRVVLQELREFGARIQARYPEESHTVEVAKFMNYVYDVASKPTGEEMPEVGYLGQHITTAFVLIGTGETMFHRGPATYVRHLRRLRDAGFEKAYLAARGGVRGTKTEKTVSIDMAERVSYLAERAGLAKRGRPMSYYATTRDGDNRLHILIEMIIIAS